MTTTPPPSAPTPRPHSAAAGPVLPVLLRSLEALGPRPALVWYGGDGRIELSGHVLANWVIKAVGHLDEEIALVGGELVVLALPPHWKRLVLALASWGLGARVQLAASGPGGPGGGEDVRLVATDDPAATGDGADEVLAVDALSLALRFDGTLPPLVHDWAQEVRAHSDTLMVPLGDWGGPVPGADPGHTLLMAGDGLEDPSAMLAALIGGRGIVGPSEAMDAHQAAQEGARPRR